LTFSATVSAVLRARSLTSSAVLRAAPAACPAAAFAWSAAASPRDADRDEPGGIDVPPVAGAPPLGPLPPGDVVGEADGLAVGRTPGVSGPEPSVDAVMGPPNRLRWDGR
jgi:hypothetical protein